MRKLVALAAVVSLALGTGLGLAQSRQPQLTGSCAKANLKTVSSGKLSVGTDNPAYPPWYGGTPKSPWKVSDPRSGKGFESAVAYAVAKQMGFPASQVNWIVVPFNTAFAPGPKKFDFDINQISYKPVRAKAVDFSRSYYDVNQAIVVLNGTPIASAKTRADLKPYKFGAQLGTTSYDTITKELAPSKQPAVFDTNDAAVAALKNKQIDGIVVDLPTAFYISGAQVPNSKVLAQFPTE